MKPRLIRAIDYQEPSHWIPKLHLSFILDSEKTEVINVMQIQKNPNIAGNELFLNGKGLELLSVSIDGRALSPSQYREEEEGLRIFDCPSSFELKIQTRINPRANKTLEGLYQSGSIFCTQNEPHGFQRITYFLDRPDVMSLYRCTIFADPKYSVLLSNGNLVGEGKEGELHWSEWEDPFPKPCYLFALVAGDLGHIREEYITHSGRSVDLRIYCDRGNEERCRYAMDSLIKAMAWDEKRFSLECDLDCYNIVAVDSFNMGAMENKGLNIFNSSCVLASEQTATDREFLRIETVVAHEYFHNWTGNRVTCRDWFQLTLKEGLTVFRDQEFSSDVQDRSVKRIEDVIDLRERQFPEDAGPLAHPIQPQSYIVIDNFYTATIYDKGAEVIRMLHTLIGEEAFQKGMKIYFQKNDGKAVRTEEFILAMEEASQRDFQQFRRWYEQVGTVRLNLSWQRKNAEEISLSVQQKGHPQPLHFPLCLAAYDADGKMIIAEKTLEINKTEESFSFQSSSDPIFSFNRDFSCPVYIDTERDISSLLSLLKHDDNAFSRWESSQELAFKAMEDKSFDHKLYIKALKELLKEKIPARLQALLLTLPSPWQLFERQPHWNLSKLWTAYSSLRQTHANGLASEALLLYQSLEDSAPYSLDQQSLGRRSLANRLLSFLYLADPNGEELCLQQYKSASNMTDRLAALALLAQKDSLRASEALSDFYERFQGDSLLLNKYWAVQALSERPDACEHVKSLLSHSAFDLYSPNAVRSLLRNFIQNFAHFHRKDGAGYALIGHCIAAIDAHNPQSASALISAFKDFPRLDAGRKQLQRKEIEKLLALKLSKNSYEKLSACLSSEKDVS